MKTFNLIDVTVVVLCIIAVALTAFIFLAAGPPYEVRDFQIQEIPSAPSAPPAYPASPSTPI